MQTRASSFYKIVSSDQICIQVVEDPTNYRLDLTSSCGDLITNEVSSTTITAIVTADGKDVTSTCSKIVWKKYVYDLNVPILDTTWGKNLNSPKITVTRDDISAKCKIECEAYLMGNDKVEYKVAGDYITLLDINDLRPSPTAPTHPREGELWLDTSVTPPVLKLYKNGKWIELSQKIEDIPGLVETIEEITGKLNGLESELNQNDLLSIDNNQDYLFEYCNSLSSTNGISPTNNYKSNILRKDVYKFNSSAYIDVLDNNNLFYDKKILNTNIDFTINMYLKAGNQIIAKDIYNIIATGDNIDSSFLTIWSYYPNATDPEGKNRRLCVEFGKDSNQLKQTITLTYPTNLKDWIMLTISYQASTKEIAIYLNGNIWGIKQLTKINPVSYFGFKRSGWYYENLVILNKLLTPSNIKNIYDSNRPFKDYSPKVIDAPTPTVIEFSANTTT